mgnify:CR=1 FL=1
MAFRLIDGVDNCIAVLRDIESGRIHKCFIEMSACVGSCIGGSVGSAIAGQFIDRMGSRGGFIVVTALALTSLAIAMLGFKQIKESTEQPTLTNVSV